MYTAPLVPANDAVIVMTRIYGAPRDLVWEAMTEARHVAQWWGGPGFTNPVCEFEARVGGEFRIHMRGPDGAVYPMKGVVQELVPPERLVFTSIATDTAGNHVLEGLTTVQFDDENGKTKLTLYTRMAAVVETANAYLQGMEIGWTQSLDKLQVYIGETA